MKEIDTLIVDTIVKVYNSCGNIVMPVDSQGIPMFPATHMNEVLAVQLAISKLALRVTFDKSMMVSDTPLS